MTEVKARSADYGLGPYTYPRGWFVVAESSELDNGPMAVSYFGKEFALYRGESGRIVMLDAYCKHSQYKSVRKWLSQFYMPEHDARAIREEINGVLPVVDFPQPSTEARDAGFEDDCFKWLTTETELNMEKQSI